MENRVKSIFGTYAEQLQVLIDANMEKFKVPFYNKFFSMGNPQVGLTYATAIGTSRIEAAASVVAHGAASPLRSRAGMEKLSGEVAAIKVKRQLDESEYRNWLTMRALSTSDGANLQQLLQLIWDDVKFVNDSVVQRLDLMTARALSTGAVPLNTTSNPDGIIPGDIDLLVTHKIAGDVFNGTTTADRLWTAALYASATPLADIMYHTRQYWNDYGIVFDKVLMSPEKLWIVLGSTEVVNLLKGFTGVASGNGYMASPVVLNQFLQANGLPIIETVDVRGAIESSGSLTSYNGWADKKYITFVPSGTLGTIHNAVSVEQLAPVDGVSYAQANNVLISKWSQTEPFGEFTRGEIAAFPGLEAAGSIVIVNTEHQTTF